MKASNATTLWHHRFYRYVRMMLRRYPKMRAEQMGMHSAKGVTAICGTPWQARFDEYARLEMEKITCRHDQQR